jgi:hypothetical protein
MESDIHESNHGMGNGGRARGVELGRTPASGPGSPVAQRHRRRKIRVEVEVPEALMGEFDLGVQEVLSGARTRLTVLEQEFKAIETRGLVGLALILDTIRSSSGGQAARLVRFLASLYLKYDCPFDLTDLRTLDTALANACLDYLNYDRLGVCDLDRHLADGGVEVEGWIRDYGYVPRASEG